jgi:processive 1,2-diacylglycerol beta-glucosyltransferase
VNEAAGAPVGATSRRALILHVRAGVGHERAARAVAQAMRELDPGADPVVRDALEFASPLLKAFYASSYNRVASRVPRLWGVVYRRSETPYHGFHQRLRTRLAMWLCRGFLPAVERIRPAAILCTQFLPAEVYATLREQARLSVPVYCAITDFAIHPIWVYRGMDHYFVAADRVKDELIATGEVPADRIEVTGVPIDPKFAKPIPKAAARRELGLDPDPGRPTLMLMGGGFGWGPIEGMLDVVLGLPDRVQALVIAGRNEALRRRLIEMARGREDRVKIHGFTDRVDLFLAAADLLISKSGGLTTSEAMARGVPMIVFPPMPGQEERNCDFLQETGAGVRVREFDELNYRLRQLLVNPDQLRAMQSRAAAIGRPRAAYDVAERMLGGR